MSPEESHPAMAAAAKTGAAAEAGGARGTLPLSVSLNGTLVRTDTLVESAVAALRQGHSLPRAFATALRGRAPFKRLLAERAPPDPALLPYNRPLLDYLHTEKQRGRRLVLATGADRAVAEAVAGHLGLFDEVIASDGTRNLRGEDKAAALRERFGERGFSHAGATRADLPVWRVAGGAVLVDAAPSLAQAAAATTRIEAELHDPRPTLRALVRALRPHQWTKNLLVFLPIVTANALSEGQAWLHAMLMFLAFCATASAIYILNDLSDLSADRGHPRKRHRPFASGVLPAKAGLVLAPMLLLVGAGFAVAGTAPLTVLLYALVSVAYSVRLKELALVDLFTLAALYTLRLFGGGEATGHPVSMWLLGFSSFLFLSLAVIKRVAELAAVKRVQGHQVVRRGYTTDDLDILQTMGVAASFVSGLVLALYVQSDTVTATYAHPQVVWAIVPLMLFWQCRLWLATARGKMHDDPIVFATRDRVSWLIGAGMVLTLLVANLPAS